MCTKQDQDRENAFSHRFRTPRCQAAWTPCQELKFFFIKHELHVNGWHYWGVLPY